jgi:hypothetical protein
MNSGQTVCHEFCVTESKQMVRNSVCEKASFRTRSTGQDIHRISSYIVTNCADLYRLYLSRKSFSPHSRAVHFFNVHFNIIIKRIHT